ncbi:MAG: hypothetical protein CBD85_003370 [Gammaproteobacteria bacterium TMED225]|nr:MAG: hypothetical protein CBD85_003370 [Gammaproteobacteria bacterium TMED225]
MPKKICFAVSTLTQIESLIELRKSKSKSSIILIKYFLIKGFGVEWLRSLINYINKKYKTHNIKFFVDSGYDQGLSILLTQENIDYIKLKNDKIILNKINQIAKKNKVLLNPTFDVVDLTKIKNMQKKLK